MIKNIRKFLAIAAIAVFGLIGVACNDDSNADVASKNLSTAADNFEVQRRIVFFNGITDTYLMTIEGRCSIAADSLDAQIEVTCKVADDAFKKHFLGLSDNVSYFVEQVEGIDVSEYRYRVVFKPTTIVPDIDVNPQSPDVEEDGEG